MQEFDAALRAGIERLARREGIGTLSERSLHAALKHWFEPDEGCHEVPLEGSVADIFDGHRVIEIQTRHLYTLRPKLEKFLPKWPVTVVHPLTWHKRLIWVEPETGESTKPRRSAKVGAYWDAAEELYALLPFLDNPNLTVVLLLLDMDEIRRRDGWSRDGKKGSHRVERIPTALGEAAVLAGREDYRILLPDGLPSPFTTADVRARTKRSDKQTGKLVSLLYKTENILRAGKCGRAYLYEAAGKGEEA